MGLITGQISQRNFELIAVRIGEILAFELPDQTVTANVSVWYERVVPFQVNELPAVNVSFAMSGDYEAQTHVAKRGTNRYYIDIHTNAKQTDSDEADKTAARFAQRIAGVIDYILSCPEYVRLGYEPGTIGSRWVSNIQIGKIGDQDALHTVVCRVIFNVTANEYQDDLEGTLIEEIQTQVKLEETDLGFLFIYES